MPTNGEIIKLDEAVKLIEGYIKTIPDLEKLGKLANERFGSSFVTELSKHNAFLIDTDIFKKLNDAKYCIVFLAKEASGKPTIVVANCNSSDDGKTYTVPDENVAALEHVPPRLIPTLSKGIHGEDKLLFSAG